MNAKGILFLLLFALFGSFALRAEDKPPVKKTDTRIKLPYAAWDAYMLGIDTPEKVKSLRDSRKRIPVIGLVSFSGLKREVHQKHLDDGREIEYVMGKPAGPNSMHDNYQISEVLQIARRLGIAMRIRVYRVSSASQFAAALARAGKESDIVLTYHSMWSGIEPMAKAIADNPRTLYIAPYAQIAKKPPTGRSLQARARHPDGTGLRNFITAVPFARNAKGLLINPLRRDKNDSETINVVSPSSYASGRGETCPSAGVAAVVAAYIVSSSPKEKISPDEIVRIMVSNSSVPEKRMLGVVNFNATSVKSLRKNLKGLNTPDATGIRRLEAEGVLDLWNICCSMHKTPKSGD